MNLYDIKNLTKGILISGKITNKEFDSISIDSRNVNKNDLFVALKGNNYDAHDFINEITKKDVAMIIVEKDIKSKSKIPIIKVESTQEALSKIGKYYRNTFLGEVIAVTGSVGKTTTKELISSILSKKYRVLKTIDNKNNHIGVPLTLSKLNNNYDVAVLELGMNHKKEISNLSKICKPDIAVITNIGTAHIGNLGKKKNILKAKLEIIDGMNNGKVIINSSDKYLNKIKKLGNNKIIKCDKKNNLSITKINSDIFKTIFCIQKDDKEYEFKLNVPGVHLVKNCLIAITIGDLYNIPFNDMIEAIGEYKPLNNRINVNIYGNNVILNDCYNSNYESVLALIKYLKETNKEKILILGDILELGKHSKKIHKKIGKIIKKNKLKNTIFIGKNMYYAHKKVKGSKYFTNNKSAIDYLKNIKFDNNIILIKASRGMHFEEVSEFLNDKLKK